MIMGQSLFEVFRNSLVMLILLVASIAALALTIERLVYFLRNRFNPGKGFLELRRRLKESGSDGAADWARTQKNPLGRMFVVALESLSLRADEMSDILYGHILDERVRYERLLGGLGTLANAATLLGLLGTVTGLIQAFGNIAMTGSGGPAVVSGGIAEALLTTAFGLFIGIPTMFFYNYFSKKAADMATVLESTSDRLVVLLSRFRERSGAAAPGTEAGPRRVEPKPAPPEPKKTAREDGWDF